MITSSSSCVTMLAASLVLIFLSQTPVEASRERPYCGDNANYCCEAQNKKFDAQNEELEAQNEKLVAQNEKLEALNEKFEAQNEKLEALNEKLEIGENIATYAFKHFQLSPGKRRGMMFFMTA